MKRAPKLLWVLLALISSAGILKATLPSTVIGAWTSAVSLSQARTNSAAALLADGRILVTGGTGGAGSLNSAEFFTPNGTVSSATAMNVGRSQHFAVTLSDGRVLVGGGITGGGTTNSAEIYDPSADSWTQTNPMTSARANASAVLLQDGRVLVVGGDNSGTPNNTIEIFDPSTGNFSFAGTLASPRTKQAMALLQDGRVLIIGGFDGTNALASSEIFDPSSGIVSAGPALAVARYSHSATTLLDGRVAIIGGVTTGSNGTSDVAYAEIFDPKTGVFSAAGVGLTTAREAHQAFLLPNNNSVLVVGGTSGGQVVAASELFVPQISPADGSWSYSFAPTGANVTPRAGASGSAMKQDGLILVAGGNDASGNALASTELYAFPVVKTDAPDYPPGTTVNISGSGFQPNETVNITLVESPLVDTHGPYTVTADGNGNFSDSSFVTDVHDLNVRFYLTVVGSQSGLVAQNTFTDATQDGDGTMTVAPTSASAGSTGNAFTFTFTNTKNGGANNFPAGSQVSLQVPTGWTAPQSTTSGNPGFVSVSGCSASIASISGSGPWTILINQTCNANSSFTLSYAGSGNKVNAPTSAGTYTFTTQSKSGTTGTLTNIQTQPVVTVTAAAANKLAFGQQPTTTAAGASISPAVTVQIQDQFGNVTTSTANVAMAIGTNPAGGTLSGTTSVAAVNGTATFSTLNIDKAGTGYTLSASSGALPGATSSAFNITAGAVSAGNSTVSANPTSVIADGSTTSTITVTLLDSGNNPVSGKTVTLSQGTGSSTISAASGPSNASGVVTFTVKDTKAEAVTYTATDSTDSIAITQKPVVTFTAGAVNATKSTVSASPGSVVADGSTTSTITVTLLDANNNPLSGKTVTLAQGTGSSIISAASGASNASGVVTFTVKDTKAETVTYSATDATDSIAISQTAQVIFTAGPASAAKSTVSANPISVTADGTTTSTITVTLLDANNNPASGKTVTLSQGTGSSTISAASGASDSSGVVTFTVRDTKAEAVIYSARDATDGVNITLTAMVTFTAGPVSAAKSTVTANPTSVTADGTTTSTITVTLLDANNNPVSGKTVALSQGTGSSTISVASGASNASGVVTFTVKDTKAETVTYSATDTTDTIAITNTASVTFNPGAITQLVFGNIGPQTAGVAFNITVTAEDAHGNTVTSYNANGNNANISSTGTLLGGSFTSQSFTNGVLVQSVTITNTGSFTITADGNAGHAASGVSGTSNSFTVNPGAPAKLVMSQQPTSTLLNQKIAPAVTVQILDANNNLTTSTANVTVGLTGSPAGVTLGGTTTVAAVAGVATFNNLSVNKAGTYTLSASSGVLTGTTSTSFTISNPVPTLTSISPVSGNLGQTLDVVFTGTNFVNGASTVNFGPDITVNTTTVNSPTQITANITIPTTATVGAHSATVTVAAPGGGTTSGQTFTVNNPATTTVVTTSGSPSTYGQSVTFTATVTSAAGTPTGSVNFYDGGTCLAPGTLLSSAGLTSGVATLTTAALSAGAHTIVASYPQTGIFNPSCAVVTQQVNKATASITVTPYNVTFDGAPHTATGTATGVGNVDLSADLVVTGTTHSAAGDYPNDGWTFTDPTGNYNPASGSVHDVINQVQVTIVLSNLTQTYDGLPKAVSYTAVPNMGGVAVIYTGVSVTYPATSNPPTNAGTYSVVASTTDPNFAGTTSGTLTIQQAALTVTANDKSRAYGTANPTFDGTITGILHSDPITATYASIATQSSPVGTYPITPTLDDGGSAALANYTVTSNNGTLTISADPLYVIAPDNSRAFGVADSQVTPALVGLVNGDTASSVGNPMCSPATTPSSAPGSYAIVCFGVTSSNYTPTYINGTLSITNPLAQITSVQDSQSHASETLEIGQTEQLTATGKLADNSTRTLAGGSGLSFCLSDLGKAVFGPAVAEAGGTLYAIGGNDGTNTLNTIQAYDPKNNAWTTITATLATARANAAVASAAGKIFVIGGVDGSGQAINSIEVLDTTSATPSVSTLTAALATARSKAGAVVWNQKLYVVAGKDGTGNPLSTVEAFDLVYGTSSQVDPGNAFDQASAAVLGNKLYVIGTNGSSVQMVSFDGTTWSAAAPSSLNAGNGVGMVAFNNLLYIVNGQNVISSDGTTFNPLSSLGNSHDGAQPAVIGSRIFIASIDPGPTSAKLDAFAPPEVTWSSADTNEATIDQAGAVNTLAITNPTVALTATSIADNSITGNFLLTVTKKSQTISFGTLSNATYGDLDVAISATSLDRGSNPTGLLVGFTSADTSICTVTASTLSGNTSGAMVHIVSAGTCSITASQPGDSTTWQAASPVVQSFTIAQAPLTITANDQSKTYGSAFTFAGTEFAATGLVNGDKVTSVTLTSGATAATATVVGSPYSIVPSAAVGPKLANYSISYVNGKFTVNPALASVTPDPGTKIYGSADPVLTGTLSGFLPADGVTATYSRTAGEMVPGPYTITATLAPAGVLSNYNITYNTANFTITPKAASVTPNTASKVYGSADPALTGTLSGFLAADGVTATYSRTTGETVLGGPYTISATLAPAGVLGNYNVSYNTAAFTITPASLLITASSGATVYGAPIAVNAGYQGFVNGDMAGSLTSPPTCGPLFTPATPAGTYVTTCTGAVDPNYNISYAPGSVTVSPAATTTSVISAPNPANWMQVVTITATVVNSSSTNVQPSGPVYFYNATGGGNCNTLPGNLALQIGTGTLTGISDTSVPNYLNTSTATVASPTLPTGTDTILACYGSNPADANYNPNFSPSNSTAFQTVTPAPIATLVANLSFGNQQAGTISPAQAAALCNGKSGTSASPCFNATDATAPLVVSSISFTGNNAGDFRFTTSPANLCGGSIPVGGSCTINVQFAPQAGTAGTATAVLNVVDNSGNIGGSTQTAPVVGAGVSTISSVGSLSTNAIFATNNGCSAVSISGNGMVDSYNGGNNAGNVGTNGNVSMNGNPVINGSVYSPFGTTGSCGKSMTGLSTSGKAQATGGLHTLAGPVTYPLPQSPSPVPPTSNWNITSCPSGLTGCTNNGSKSVTLAPGQYGNLSISGGTTAHVKAGTYNVNSLSLTGNSVLYVDSGPVVINLAGGALSSNAAVFDSSSGSIVNPSGVTSNLQVYFARSNVIKLSGGSGSYALVYAPNATISITGGSHFYGSIVANTVSSSGNTAIHGDLGETAIAAGNTLWFSMSGLNVQGLPTNQTVKLYLTNAVLNFTANGQAQAPIAVPDAVITFSSTATSASTKWDAINNRWSTIVPTSSINSNSTIHTFFDGIALPVPAGGFPNGIQNASLQAAFSTSSTGLSFSWQWGAAVYNAFGNNSALSVNPLDNTDPAGTPESYKPNLVFGDMGPGYVGMYVGSTSVIPTIAPANASPSSLDFGTVNVGTTTLGFMKSTLTNNQSGTTLTISSVTLGGTDPGDFALLVNNQEPGVVNCITGGSNPSYQSVSSLAPGQSCSIYATAAPATVGKRSARVAFSDNANNSPQTVYLTVIGQ